MNQNLQNKSETPSHWRGTKVTLEWREGRDDVGAWNEICAWAIEQFGLPGTKFEWHPTEEYMEFFFYDEKDAILFNLRWL